jgi:hypothetical protein
VAGEGRGCAVSRRVKLPLEAFPEKEADGGSYSRDAAREGVGICY